jgi:hypothetical protein
MCDRPAPTSAHFLTISRSRLFKAISAGLLPVESSQLVKSLIRTRCSTGRFAYPHHEAGRTLPEVFAPRIFAEDAQGLGDRFVETLRTDLNRMFDALGIGPGAADRVL